MSTEENALVVFEELKVPGPVRSKILELDPEFAERPREEQIEVAKYLIEQAAATIDGVKSRFPEIGIKHAGAKSIELPRLVGEDDGAIVREFEAVIIDQHRCKAYWEQGDANGTPPDCSSLDGLKPYGAKPVTTIEQGGCIACPFNKFGSGLDKDGNPTNGKRCRDAKRLIVDLAGHDLPCRLQLSVMNIKPFDQYLSDLRDQGIPMSQVVTRFRAVEAKNRGGTEYTGVEFTAVRRLSMNEALEVKRTKVDPFKAEFRQGALEAFTDEAGPPSTGQKASEAMDAAGSPM